MTKQPPGGTLARQRKRGRPATGTNKALTLRLAPALLAWLDGRVDAELGDTRADVIREILEKERANEFG